MAEHISSATERDLALALESMDEADKLELASFKRDDQDDIFPVAVDQDNLKAFNQDFLDAETIERLRNAGTNSAEYRGMYLPWRRRAVVRLHAQGYKYEEIATQLGISTYTVALDIKRVRQEYAGAAKRDWALVVEERIMSIEADLHDWRREADYARKVGNTDQRLRIFDMIQKLEDKRDKLLGLDKAAASQYEETTNLKINLSFGDTLPPQPQIITTEESPPELPEETIIDAEVIDTDSDSDFCTEGDTDG